MIMVSTQVPPIPIPNLGPNRKKQIPSRTIQNISLPLASKLPRTRSCRYPWNFPCHLSFVFSVSLLSSYNHCGARREVEDDGDAGGVSVPTKPARDFNMRRRTRGILYWLKKQWIFPFRFDQFSVSFFISSKATLCLTTPSICNADSNSFFFFFFFPSSHVLIHKNCKDSKDERTNWQTSSLAIECIARSSQDSRLTAML